MPSPESNFYQTSIQPKLKKWGAAFDRIETLGSGIADISYSLSGADGWIELKVAKGNRVYFRKYQIPWLLTRCAQSPRIFIMVLDKKGFIWLIPGHSLMGVDRRKSGEAVSVLLTDLWPIATGKSGNDPEFWNTVKESLVRR